MLGGGEEELGEFSWGRSVLRVLIRGWGRLGTMF